jgi:hypothetical protein
VWGFRVGLTIHSWSKASVTALRGLALLPELWFCLDLLLDEPAHAQQQVMRVT